MKKVLIAIAMIVGISLVPSAASAHHPLVTGTCTDFDDDTWTVTWVIYPDRDRDDVTWQIVSPDGYSPSGSQTANLPFTRTVTYPDSRAVAWEVVTASWSDGSGGRRAGSVSQAQDCTAPTPTDPVPTDPVPTDPVPTDPVPTDPVPTDPVPTDPVPTDPVPAPTDPVPTDPVPTDPVPAPTDPGSTDPVSTDPVPAPTDPTSTDPVSTDPVSTDPVDVGPDGPDDPTAGTPDTGGPTTDLPQTGGDGIKDFATVALVLLIVGALTWVGALGKRSQLLDN